LADQGLRSGTPTPVSGLGIPLWSFMLVYLRHDLSRPGAQELEGKNQDMPGV
jgi:hypothetical protein